MSEQEGNQFCATHGKMTEAYLQACYDSVYLQAVQFSPSHLRVYVRRRSGDGEMVKTLFDASDRHYNQRGFWVVHNLAAYSHVKCVQVATTAFLKQNRFIEAA